MATIADMYDSWCTEELRGDTQVNKKVWLARFNKGLLIFQKMILEYVSGKQNTSHVFRDIVKGQDEYQLPLGVVGKPDFYSIIQLRIAYKADKNGLPLYRICKPIDFSEYNIRPLKNYPTTGDVKIQGGQQHGGPMVWDRISRTHPRYVFVDKDTIKIFPTPTEDVTNGLTLTYNFIEKSISYDDAFGGSPIDISTLNLPWYFLDAIEDYITFRLYQAENPEMSQWYYQQFENTLHDNIYGLNKDKRPIDEGFADLRYFYHY